MRRRVEEDRAHRKPNRAIDRALKRHVNRPVCDLWRRSGEIQVSSSPRTRIVTLIGKSRRAGTRVILKSVEHGTRGIITVRQCRYRSAHHPLGGIEHRLARGGDRVKPVELDQFIITLRPNPRRGNLRVHVAQDQIRKPDIGPQHVPDLLKFFLPAS